MRPFPLRAARVAPALVIAALGLAACGSSSGGGGGGSASSGTTTHAGGATANGGATPSAASPGTPVHGGNLVIARTADSQSMNNTNVFDNESIWIFENIFPSPG